MTHRAEPAIRAVSPAVLAALAVVAPTLWWWQSAPALRALADTAAVCALGLTVVGYLDGELARRAGRLLGTVGLCWLLLETVRLGVLTQLAAGFDPTPYTLWVYASQTRAGFANLVAVLAAALLCCCVWTGAPRLAAAGLVVTGLLTRTLAGHLAATPVGTVLLAVHVVAAGLWCGTLLALVLTVRHRSGWARALPAYSRLALPCVVLLLGSGVVGALLVLDSPHALYGTAYGWLLVAKAALTLVLVMFGVRYRRTWVPAARAQSTSVASSGRRAVAELAVMWAALTAAAVLSLTGAT